MVGVAQLVERRLVVADVAGSSPVTHPNHTEPLACGNAGQGLVYFPTRHLRPASRPSSAPGSHARRSTASSGPQPTPPSSSTTPVPSSSLVSNGPSKEFTALDLAAEPDLAAFVAAVDFDEVTA